MHDSSTDADRPGGPRRRHSAFLQPGDWVTHPGQPDWGVGQVQSVVGSRITVGFEHAGKVLVNTAHVDLGKLDR
jgi:hypothetical protein